MSASTLHLRGCDLDEAFICFSGMTRRISSPCPALLAYTVAYLNRHDSSWSVERLALDFGLSHHHGLTSYAVG